MSEERRPSDVVVELLGGPSDGLQHIIPKEKMDDCLGKTLVFGHVDQNGPAYYKFDTSFSDDGRLYARFVRTIPRRKRTQ